MGYWRKRVRSTELVRKLNLVRAGGRGPRRATSWELRGKKVVARYVVWQFVVSFFKNEEKNISCCGTFIQGGKKRVSTWNQMKERRYRKLSSAGFVTNTRMLCVTTPVLSTISVTNYYSLIFLSSFTPLKLTSSVCTCVITNIWASDLCRWVAEGRQYPCSWWFVHHFGSTWNVLLLW